MNRKVVIALLALPLGIIPLVTKPASAAAIALPSTLSQNSIVVAQRYDDRRDSDRFEAARREADRREAERREAERRESRRVWVAGHWEHGFLGIGRKWVAGHWETR